ncbi:MAG: hypothetical protein HQL48_02240 [Gammaproteobacteria bacterium]|nr:hypothetical protein [Gammaproteobacteria bacterium]
MERGQSEQRARRRQSPFRDFSLLALLVALFIYIAIDRLWELRLAAERSHVTWMVGSMQTALSTTVLARIASGRIQTLSQLGSSNPFHLMTNLPPTYLGELDSPPLESIPGKSWYFDRDSGELLYRIQFEDSFPAIFTAEPLIHFSIQFEYQDVDGDGRYDPLIDLFSNIELVSSHR